MQIRVDGAGSAALEDPDGMLAYDRSKGWIDESSAAIQGHCEREA
jgi:hypothetical protein